MFIIMQIWKVLTCVELTSSCTEWFWQYWIEAIEQLLEKRLKPVHAFVVT